jgi:hypothetical protein
MHKGAITGGHIDDAVAVGKVYVVDHFHYGLFVARAEEPHEGWCGWVIVHGNPKLHLEQFDEGTYVEMTAAFYRATAIQ